MKIDIITLSCAMNYGAVLQTYGLYAFMEDNGFTTEVIDYIPRHYNFDAPDYTDKYLEHTRLWKKNFVLRYIWKKIVFSKILQDRKVFSKFLLNNLTLTKTYYPDDELETNPPIADIYVTGSDQLWNSDYFWEVTIEKPYYLDFLPDDTYRIAYASSFGKEKLSSTEAPLVKECLSKYSYISVREKSGLQILKSIGLNGIEMADPVILCNLEKYVNLADSAGITERDYILLFMIGFNRKLYRMADKLARENKKKLITLIPSNIYRNIYVKGKIILPSVEEWCGYMKNASYIITNSFHGSVFAILFNRNFSSCMAAGYNGRIYNLLDKTGLLERTVGEEEYNKIKQQYDNEIDYFKINKKVNDWRAYSQKWLLSSIRDSM